MLDKDLLLTQLFENDYCEQTFPLGNGKYKVRVKTISGADQVEIGHAMSKFSIEKKEDLTNSEYIHEYTLQILSHVVLGAGKYSYTSPKESYEGLKKLSATVIDEILKCHRAMEDFVRNLLNAKDTIESFFGPQSTDSEQPLPLQGGNVETLEALENTSLQSGITNAQSKKE